MSDTSQGHGWWQASDGRWYPPEQHPDATPTTPPVVASGVPAGAYGTPFQGAAPHSSPPSQQKKSNKGIWITLGVVLAVVVIGVWGCLALISAGTEAVVDGAANAVEGVAGEVGEELEKELNENDATAVGGGDAGTEAEPLPLGTEADLGNGWRIRVDSANLNATADVLAADEFNQEPSEGMRYAVVSVTMFFDGDGTKQRESPALGLDVSLWGSDRVERSESFVMASLDDEIDSMSDIAAGSSLTGTAVFEVGANETDLALLATPTISFDRTEAWLALE